MTSDLNLCFGFTSASYRKLSLSCTSRGVAGKSLPVHILIMGLNVEMDDVELSVFSSYRFKKEKLCALKYFVFLFIAKANYKTVSVFCLINT